MTKLKEGHYAGIALSVSPSYISDLSCKMISNHEIIDSILMRAELVGENRFFMVTMTIKSIPMDVTALDFNPSPSYYIMSTYPKVDEDVFKEFLDKCSFKYVGEVNGRKERDDESYQLK